MPKIKPNPRGVILERQHIPVKSLARRYAFSLKRDSGQQLRLIVKPNFSQRDKSTLFADAPIPVCTGSGQFQFCPSQSRIHTVDLRQGVCRMKITSTGGFDTASTQVHPPHQFCTCQRIFACQMQRDRLQGIRAQLFHRPVGMQPKRIAEMAFFIPDIVRGQVYDVAPHIPEQHLTVVRVSPCNRLPAQVVEHRQIDGLFRMSTVSGLQIRHRHIEGGHILEERVLKQLRNLIRSRGRTFVPGICHAVDFCRTDVVHLAERAVRRGRFDEGCPGMTAVAVRPIGHKVDG